MHKATDTPSEYVILVFPEQQLLRECASVLTLYAHCLSSFVLCVAHIKHNGIQSGKFCRSILYTRKPLPLTQYQEGVLMVYKSMF